MTSTLDHDTYTVWDDPGAVEVVPAPSGTIVVGTPAGGSIVGPPGPAGEPGPAGPAGPTGAASTVPGPPGEQGIQGIQGVPGSQGPPGSTGATGSTGSTGPQGNPGTSVRIVGEVATVGALPPAGSVSPGDSYIVTADGDLWTSTGTAWVDVGQIVGPQGPAGATGATGSQGVQGIQGVPGSQGIQGIQGVPGTAGEKGDPGEPGGSLLTAFWTYATNTTAPPSSGQARTDAGLTTLWLAETDTDGMNRAAGLATAEAGDTIIVRAANGTAMDLLITGTPTDAGTYWAFPISVTTGSVTKGARTQFGILSPTPHGIPAGGTTNQVLGKTSGADYAVSWRDDVSGGGGGITTEDAVDAVATALVAGNNIDITYNDAANTITVDVESLTSSDVGLGNVDNTADAAKPVSTATQTALDAKATTAALTAHETDTTAIHGIADTSLLLTTTTAATTYAPIRRTLNAQTGTTYTPAVADENLMVTLSNASAITVTLPQNSAAAFPVGAEVDFLWLGVGQPTFAAGTGATVNATPGLKLTDRYSACTAKKIDTNAWVLIGRLSA